MRFQNFMFGSENSRISIAGLKKWGEKNREITNRKQSDFLALRVRRVPMLLSSEYLSCNPLMASQLHTHRPQKIKIKIKKNK